MRHVVLWILLTLSFAVVLVAKKEWQGHGDLVVQTQRSSQELHTLAGQVAFEARQFQAAIGAAVKSCEASLGPLRTARDSAHQALQDAQAKANGFCSSSPVCEICKGLNQACSHLPAALVPQYRGYLAAADAVRSADQTLSVGRDVFGKADSECAAFLDGFGKDQATALDRRKHELDLSRQKVNGLTNELNGSWIRVIQSQRSPLMFAAASALVAMVCIILSPFLLSAALWFGIAPWASRVVRRPTVRPNLSPNGATNVMAMPSASVQQQGPSVVLDLLPGQELVVVPEYLARPPRLGESTTRWLIAPQKPMVSLASGLVTMLELVTPEPGDLQLAVPTTCPWLELVVLDIPEGESVVVRPGAIVAVIKAANEPLLLSSSWSVGSAYSWATLQFRQFIVAGPVRLVLRCGRGVSVHDAAASPRVDHDRVLAYSTRLSVQSRRSGAYVAFAMGRRGLFDDMYKGASGACFTEFVPSQGARGGIARPFGVAIDVATNALGF